MRRFMLPTLVLSTLVAPLHQLGARVGCCLPLPSLHALAFTMVRTAGWEQGRRGKGPGAGRCSGGSKRGSQMRAFAGSPFLDRRITSYVSLASPAHRDIADQLYACEQNVSKFLSIK